MSTLIPFLRDRFGPYAQILLIFLASRLMLTLIGVLAVANLGNPFPHGSLLDWTNIQYLYARWDSVWYLSIIENGYEASGALERLGTGNFAFFPLYPLLVIATQQATSLPAITAGLLVSNLTFFAALVFIFEYVRALGWSDRAGIMTALLLCFVPHSFVFSAIYTESAFILLLVVAMSALRQQRWLSAGLCAALLSATRANGIFFIIFAGIWLLRQYGLQPLAHPWRHPERLLPIALAPLGLVLFWWFCFFATGDAFAQMSTARHGWGWETDFPWRNLTVYLTSENINTRFSAIISLLILVFSCSLLRFRLYEEFLLCLGMMALYWCGVLPGSLVRYSIALFPVFIGIAGLLENRPLAFWLLLSLFSLLNGFLMTTWTQASMITI